ncbi:MAG: hypothetical protein IT254_01700 [Chitinophagaceae bacterium]|nr:hypothetical protein [Bacteroidota bacterium]MCC6257015.1 hypothetical protein [Chitinophagaceae bacterium]MCW5917625.1 hypothetical protein [Ferruginibacter sp.]
MADFSKYQFPKKVYLSGPDCFHLMLDLHARKHGAGGNVMRKVFYFQYRINAERIRHTLHQSPGMHWLCNIKLCKGFLFAKPFWKYRNENRQVNILLHEEVEEGLIPEMILKREMPVGSAAYIEVDILFFTSGKSALVFSWNHILIDARGSALFFEHLNRIADGTVDEPSALFPPQENEPGLWTYIRNMYKVKAFIEQSSHKPVSSIADKDLKIKKDNSRSLVISFSPEEAEQIQRSGIKAGSKFGPTHYYLSCCAIMIHRLLSKRGRPGPLWIPVPYDGRLKGGLGPLFSNHVSFIFYRFEVEQLASIPLIVKELGKQMTDQIRIRMPGKYNMLLNMMRHFPLWLYYFLISRTGEGSIASFLYTSTGENFSHLPVLLGEQVEHIGMVPALTFPPGFTFLFLKQQHGLHLNISYLPEVISEAELNFVIAEIKELLLHS